MDYEELEMLSNGEITMSSTIEIQQRKRILELADIAGRSLRWIANSFWTVDKGNPEDPLNKLSLRLKEATVETVDNDDLLRGVSALLLADMALQHGSGSAEAAAKLLLAMERGKPFDFQLLLRFDSKNRAHADTLLLGYESHNIWPSRWIDEAGGDGTDLMDQLHKKWG